MPIDIIVGTKEPTIRQRKVNMCRARLGPRCSGDALKRIDKAVENFQRIEELVHEARRSRTYDESWKRRYQDSIYRLRQAEQVWNTSKRGLDELGLQVEEARQLWESVKDSEDFSALDKREIRKTYVALRDTLRYSTHLRAEGLKQSRLDKGQRSELRLETVRRGGEQSFTGRPLRPETAAARREELGSPSGIRLSQYDPEERVFHPSWQDASVNGQNNYRVPQRHPVFPHNTIISRGDGTRLNPRAFEAEFTHTKLNRINSPDGNLIEYQHTYSVVKTEDGKYALIELLRTDSSWEDVSPGDTTQQPLGHLLEGSRTKPQITLLGEYETADLAKARVKSHKRVSDVEERAVRMGRAQLMARFANPTRETQRRGNLSYGRHDSTAQTEAGRYYMPFNISSGGNNPIEYGHLSEVTSLG